VQSPRFLLRAADAPVRRRSASVMAMLKTLSTPSLLRAEHSAYLCGRQRRIPCI